MNRKTINYAWWILVSCAAIAMSVLGFMCNGVGVFLAPVCEELGFSRSSLSAYMSILQIIMVISLPVAGKLFLRVNVKLLLSFSIIIYAGGFFIMSQGHSLASWYIAGILQGIAGGFLLYLPIPLLINNWFKIKTGFALGVALAFSGVGGAIINPVTQYFITNHSWRAGYIILAIIAMAVSLPFVLFVIYFKPSDLGLEPYGADQTAWDSSTSEITGINADAAVKTLPFYFMFFTGALLALAANFNQHIPGYLTSLDYPAMVGATAASTVMSGVMIGKILLGILNDRFGLKFASACGLLCGVFAMTFLFLDQLNIYIIYLGSFLYGFGYAMLTLEPPLIIKAIFGSKDYSSILSYITTTQAVVGAVGVYFFALVFDLTKSFAANLVIVAIAYLISLFLIFMSLNLGKKLNLSSDSST